jgi:hypothetical protein
MISSCVFIRWGSPSILDQCVLFLAAYGADYVAAFLKRISVFPEGLDNPEFLYSIVGATLANESLGLLRALIDLRFFLPRVEMFRRIIQTSGSTPLDLLIIGEIPAFPVDAHPFIRRDAQPVYDSDIRFGSSRTFVYADLRNTSVLRFVCRLIEAKSAFVLRPVSFREASGPGARLLGWGAEWRELTETADFDQPIYEVFVGTGQTAPPISWLEEEMPQPRARGPMTDLAVRLMIFLRRYKNVSLPLIVRDITNNWPLIAALPSTHAEYKAVVDEVRGRQDHLTVNGRSLPTQGVDIFSLMETVLEEDALRNLVRQSLGLTSDLVFRTGLSLGGRYMLDFRGDAVRWWNDLEKDVEYESWTDDVMSFVRERPGGRGVRRNLVHMVCYFDLENATQLDTFALLANFVEKVPLRLGLVPCANLGKPLGRKIAFAFEHLALISNRIALDWLLTVHNEASSLDNLATRWQNLTRKEADFSRVFDRIPNKTVAWDKLHTLFVPSSTEFARVKRASQYFRFYVVSKGTIMLDGKMFIYLVFRRDIRSLKRQCRTLSAISHASCWMRRLLRLQTSTCGMSTPKSEFRRLMASI